MKSFRELLGFSKKVEKIEESIIDIPRRTYAPGVFDDADTKNPKLKQSVKDIIYKQFKEFEKEYPIVKFGLIGSILTKRYRNDADLDINVLFKVPPGVDKEKERERLSKKYLSASNPDNIQGKEIPGTQHPINYYFVLDPKTYDSQAKKADAVYSITQNKFIKRPEDYVFDPKLYVKEFERKVQEMDVVKGELKRDIIDYDELKELKPDDILNLQEKINEKLEEIEEGIRQFKELGAGVDAERRAAFDRDMTPDEIKKFSIKNRLPKNVVYKMLEKYHYMTFFKKCKKILQDGEVTDAEIDSIRNEEYISEAKKVAFAFGRFNPPTIGHEKLINKVKSQPGDYRIYLSRSNDPKKNPLTPEQKLKYMRSIFPAHRQNILINTTNMVLDIATDLYNKGYKEVTMVAGSDRVREFETILTKYNGERNRHGYYNFDKIKVVSAGERDPDAEGAVGMSASKMRAAAAKGDIDSFKKGLPKGADAVSLMKDVRKGMNLAASFGGQMQVGTGARPIVSLEKFEQNQIRDLYIREVLFNIGDTVKYTKEDVEGKVVRRGTNYVVLEDNENNLKKAWIWDCIPVASDKEVAIREYNLDIDYGFEAVSEKKSEYGHTDSLPQDKDVEKQKGTQPKKYYKDLSKDTKSKRASHFRNTDTTKNDNDPAPGDKDAKTVKSKHTTKYDKMYGNKKEACWSGYTQKGMKKKGDKMVPNCVPESTEIGQDYAKHTSTITPGEPSFDGFENPNYKPAPEGSGEKIVRKTFKGFLGREKDK